MRAAPAHAPAPLQNTSHADPIPSDEPFFANSAPYGRPGPCDLDQLCAGLEELLHVSSSFRYDLITAHGLGIRDKVRVSRGHEPPNPFYGCHEIPDIGGLPALLGL